MTAEVADGWLPIFFVPEKVKEVLGGALTGRGRGQARSRARRAQIAAGGLLAIGEGADVAPLRELNRPMRRPLHRRHGRQGQELLQRARLPLRLRGRGGGDPGALSRRARRRRRRRWCPPSSSRRLSLCGPESYIKERVAALRRGGRDPPQRHAARPRSGCRNRKAAKLGVAAAPSVPIEEAAGPVRGTRFAREEHTCTTSSSEAARSPTARDARPSPATSPSTAASSRPWARSTDAGDARSTPTASW